MDNYQVWDAELLPRIYHHISSAVSKALKDALQQYQVPKDSINEDFLSSEQAAAFLKIKLGTVYAKAERGELPFCKVGKRKLLFAKADLDNYLASRRVKSRDEISEEVFNYEKGKK